MPKNTWKFQRSILFELDTIFSLLNDYLPLASLSNSINQLVDSIPPEMVHEIRTLLARREQFFGFLFAAGFSSQTEFEEDYVQATMPIRKMRKEDFVQLTIARAAEYGIKIEVDSSQPLLEQMYLVHSQLVRESGQRIGYIEQSGEIQNLTLKSDIELLAGFLADGDNHDQFWHWLDRFYYQIYQTWRQTKVTVMDESEERANLSLGASSDQLLVDWLPQVNPLRFSPVMTESIKRGILHVIFLVEPFELPDSWFVIPDGMVITFADNEVSFQRFIDFVNNLSERLKALADPNRLLIMRIARQTGKDNTEIAGFLNVSRPTVSVHAKQLREAGLIETFEDGRSVRHEVVSSEVRQLFRDLERFLDLPPQD
jgi:DNA-binding transcriptional ArsR family regulator